MQRLENEISKSNDACSLVFGYKYSVLLLEKLADH